MAFVHAGPWTIPRFGGLEWTPDGRHILFSRAPVAGGSSTAADIALWRVSVDGSKPEKILVTGGYVIPTVHPDGGRIAFGVRQDGDVLETWVMQNFLPPLGATR